MVWTLSFSQSYTLVFVCEDLELIDGLNVQDSNSRSSKLFVNIVGCFFKSMPKLCFFYSIYIDLFLMGVLVFFEPDNSIIFLFECCLKLAVFSKRLLNTLPFVLLFIEFKFISFFEQLSE